MAYHLGQDATETDPLARLEARQETLLREFREAEERRKLATLFAVAGAIFAAFRLGVVAVPELRRHREEWRAKRQPVANPRRRRR